MYAALGGHSTLGIPKSVAEKFVGKGHDAGGSSTVDLPALKSHIGYKINTKDGELPAKDMSKFDWRAIRDGLRALFKFVDEEEREPEHAEDAKNTAASVIFIEPTGHILFTKRAPTEENWPDTWSLPGGKADPGEAPADCAAREAAEETGRDCAEDDLHELETKATPYGWEHTTFACPVEERFTPKLNGEHSAHVWAPWDEPPQPLHPGVQATLDKLRDDLGDDEDAAFASLQDELEAEDEQKRDEKGQFSASEQRSSPEHQKHFTEQGKSGSHVIKDPRSGNPTSVHGPFGHKDNAAAYAKGMGLGRKHVKSRPAGYVVEKPYAKDNAKLESEKTGMIRTGVGLSELLPLTTKSLRETGDLEAAALHPKFKTVVGDDQKRDEEGKFISGPAGSKLKEGAPTPSGGKRFHVHSESGELVGEVGQHTHTARTAVKRGSLISKVGKTSQKWYYRPSKEHLAKIPEEHQYHAGAGGHGLGSRNEGIEHLMRSHKTWSAKDSCLAADSAYQVKELAEDGTWCYSRPLLEAASRRAWVRGRADLARRADAIVKQEFAQDALAMDWCNEVGLCRVPTERIMAFDRESVRRYDTDGHLHVAESNISKACVSPYRGDEIPDYKRLGLAADKVYKLLRDPEELRAAVSTANGKPILWQHKPTEAQDHATDLVIGSTGDEARYEHPWLKNSLHFWPAHASKAIESGEQADLSSGYRYDADMTPGTFDGERYDGVMRNIKLNHLALVQKGRVPGAVVGDAARGLEVAMDSEDSRTGKNAPVGKTKEQKTMPTTAKLSPTAVYAMGSLGNYLAPRLAQDAKIDLKTILLGTTAKNFADRAGKLARDVKRAVKGRLAQDADVDDVEEVIDAIQEMAPEIAQAASEPDQEDLNAVTENDDDTTRDSPEAMAKALEFLKDKLSPEDLNAFTEMMGEANVVDPTEPPPDDEDRMNGDGDEAGKMRDGAMDAKAVTRAVKLAVDSAVAQVREDTTALRDAERFVRPLVGELSIACDSADDVYRHALKLRGFTDEKLAALPPAAYRPLLEALPRQAAPQGRGPALATDAKPEGSFRDRFPGAGRIGLR